jgi:hypothetical protein
MKHLTRKTVAAFAACLLTLSIVAAPPTPQQIAAEIERLTKANQQLAKDPAALAIFAAKASGIYSTDRTDPETLAKNGRGKDINGHLKTGTTLEETLVSPFGRTAEMQRFLEMHDLAATIPVRAPGGTKELIRISRNRIRFVAAILNKDISKMEEAWRQEDLTSALNDMSAALRAIATQQERLGFEIQMLRMSQPQNIR